jgi:hypothetical protein
MIVYTAVFGGYDTVFPAPIEHEGVRFVCYSDREQPDSAGWDVRIVDLPSLTHPYIQRWHKIMSHRLFPDEEVTLYLDGNLELLVSPLEIAANHLQDSDIVLFKHPERSGVYEEIEACADLGKDRPDLLEGVRRRYEKEGMPSEGYLHAAGLILRRHTDEVVRLNELWMDELLKTSVRDQPALAFALWKTGVEPSVIRENIWRNGLVRHRPHKAKLLLKDRRYLFVGGNPRTGTTALCDLLNSDPRLIVGKERYRRIRERLGPEHFLKKRFFNPTPRETSFLPERLIPPDEGGFTVWPEDEAALRAKWDSPEIAYIGDKAPLYVWQLPYLRRTFPEARFVIAFRDPLSVANSYQQRASNLDDHWPVENDFSLALEHWNRSLRELLGYLHEFGLGDLFLIDYDTFFSGEVGYLRSLYLFLELDPDEAVVARFVDMTKGWESRRQKPTQLSDEMQAEIRDLADWNSYWELRRLIPLMSDYRLLASENRQSARAQRKLEMEREQHQEVIDLSRTLYSELREMSSNSNEFDALWKGFWVPRSGQSDSRPM